MLKKRIFFAVFFILGLFFLPNLSAAKESVKLMVFHSPSCSRCIEAKRSLFPDIENKYRGKIELEYYDLGNVDNYKLLLGLKEKYNQDIALELPVIFIQGNLLNGRSDLKTALPMLIDLSLATIKTEEDFRHKDLVEYFKSLGPWVILGSGLVDGINPCAFTVIVFFVSYLALQGYRRKEMLIVGLSFVFSVFVTYSLIGLGLFNFLYRLKGFWIFVKVFNLSVGIFSILLGSLALYDFFKFLKTKDTQGLALQLPGVIKNRIHKVIGDNYRKASGSKIPRLILSALVTGFLVSLLEAVCTGQLYLPTIAFVLKTTTLKWQALLYLVYYNIMFILPLLAVLFLALLGVTSVQFASFLRKNLAIVKIIMAAVFLSLGIFLIFKG